MYADPTAKDAEAQWQLISREIAPNDTARMQNNDTDGKVDREITVEADIYGLTAETLIRDYGFILDINQPDDRETVKIRKTIR